MSGLTHAFTSAKSDGADATQVQPSNWNAPHKIDATGVAVNLDTTTGGVLPLQPLVGQRRILWWALASGVASGTLNMMGGSVNSLGTTTVRNAATTNMFTLSSRQGYVSASTANSRTGAYLNSNYYVRGNVAGFGGFRAFFRFGISDSAAVATANMFVGMLASSSMLNGAEPSTANNMIGIGHDSTDTVLQLMTNDGTGTATKSSLGANFPINTANVDMYELALYCAPNDTKIAVQVRRLNTGDTFTTTVTTDLPVNTQAIWPGFFRGNVGTALAVGVDIMSLYVESET